MSRQTVIDEFHKLWRDECINDKLTFMGIQTCKTPMDLWVYQEIIHELQPNLIIECGTYKGGTTNYLANLLNGNGSILSIDIEQRDRPQHNSIEYVVADSIGDGFESAKRVTRHSWISKVLVILDSDHTKDHVLKEMELYAELVTPGSYMIVEDSDLNGHPTGDQSYWPLGQPGPHEAIEEFLLTHDEFEIDKSREKFLVTVCRDGFLRKKK